MVLLNGNLRICTVASGGAGQVAGQAFEVFRGVHAVAQRLAGDKDRSAVLVALGNLLDARVEHVEGVIGMGVEDATG